MHIKSAIDLGRMVRLSRNQKGWSQSELAEKMGTSQRWVSEIENGKSRAELGRVLKCLRVLDVVLEATVGTVITGKAQARPDLYDQVLSENQRFKRRQSLLGNAKSNSDGEKS